MSVIDGDLKQGLGLILMAAPIHTSLLPQILELVISLQPFLRFIVLTIAAFVEKSFPTVAV